MTQSIVAFNPTRGLNVSHRKEKNAFYSYSLIDLDRGSESAVIRLYYSTTGAVNYACLWVHRGEPFYASGSGKAGGYGYHRPSAAAHYAFKAAGIQLAEPIDGRGDEAIRDAMRALGEYLGINRMMIHTANG